MSSRKYVHELKGTSGGIGNPVCRRCLVWMKRKVVCWDDCTGSMVPFGHNRTYAKEELEGGGTGTGAEDAISLRADCG